MKTLVQFQLLVDQKIATIHYNKFLQSAVFIYLCSSGLPIRKSVLEYFTKVVAVAFLVSSPIKFENSAGGMHFGGRYKYASRLCDC